ncbi:hypothetical protein Q9233_004607 [Columba guinea]|nr:hypothetical protein Q9233_004607 [Columba guinea]
MKQVTVPGRGAAGLPRSLPADGLPAAGAGGRHRGCVPRLRERGGAGAAQSQDQAPTGHLFPPVFPSECHYYLLVL